MTCMPIVSVSQAKPDRYPRRRAGRVRVGFEGWRKLQIKSSEPVIGKDLLIASTRLSSTEECQSVVDMDFPAARSESANSSVHPTSVSTHENGWPGASPAERTAFTRQTSVDDVGVGASELGGPWTGTDGQTSANGVVGRLTKAEIAAIARKGPRKRSITPWRGHSSDYLPSHGSS
ncbi:hypothetical protein BDV59DRAFT_73548 [Aspergillus ambiguus]|uniref:uncharacterized protein n=1 Tax=Aspergillus ambiguus TaxID=176160 RepID=UPI003CCDFF4A